MQFDERILPKEWRDQARELLDHSGRAAHTNKAARLPRCDCRSCTCPFDFNEDVSTVSEKRLPRIGQSEAPGRPLDKTNPETPFKARYPSAQLGFRYPGSPPSGGETGVLCHRSEEEKIVDLCHDFYRPKKRTQKPASARYWFDRSIIS